MFWCVGHEPKPGNIHPGKKRSNQRKKPTGKLRIGNQWNAISIIALSQHSPLKAIAEFVENSIDAGAKRIDIIKGKEKRNHFLRIIDDGHGIRLNADGIPDFKYVATHICDSLKRQLKEKGDESLQGEFGIGLLGFWALGDKMTISSNDDSGGVWQMTMLRGESGYHIEEKPVLMTTPGTEITIHNVGRSSSATQGEKISQFLAEELSERIKSTNVEITVVDNASKYETVVKPREFTGQLIELPDDLISKVSDEIAIELYFKANSKNRRVALFKNGTRVLEDVSHLDSLNAYPWNSGFFQGRIEVGYLNLAPATRLGVVADEVLEKFYQEISDISEYLKDYVFDYELSAQIKSTDENRKKIKSAMRESLLALHSEGIKWTPNNDPSEDSNLKEKTPRHEDSDENLTEESGQKLFFQIAGALHSVVISPSSTVIQAYGEQEFQAYGRDKQRRVLSDIDKVEWEIMEGNLTVIHASGNKAILEAPGQPGLARIRATLHSRGLKKYSEALITITDSAPFIEFSKEENDPTNFIPDFKLVEKKGELWRSRFLNQERIIHINSGHRDYIYAAKNKKTLTRYLSKLYCKELILQTSSQKSPEDILEQMVQLETYMDQNLKN